MVLVATPAHLSTHASALRLSWYDRLTGATVRSGFQPLRRVSTIPVILSPATRVLAPAALGALRAPPGGLKPGTQSHVALIFTRAPLQVRTLKPGDIIVSGVTRATPYGLLRKVTSVVRYGHRLVISTAPALLTDVILQGTFHVHLVLTRRSVRSVRALMLGVSVHPIQPLSHRSGRPNLDLPLSVCESFSLDFVSATDQADPRLGSAKGETCLSASIDFNVDIGFFHAPRVSFKVTLKETFKGVARVTARTLYAQKKEEQLVNLPFDPITIPVVIVPKLVIKVGYRSQVAASVTARFTQTMSTTGEVDCDGTDCQTHSSKHTEQDGNLEPTGNADAQVYADQNVETDIYGVAGPFVGLREYGKAEVDTGADPWWKLYAGIQVNIGLNLDAFIVKLEYRHTLFELRLTLAQAAGPLVPSGTPTPTMGVSTTIPTPVVAPSSLTSMPYASTVLHDQPLLYYRLDDGGDTAADASGHGADATYDPRVVHRIPGALVADHDQAIESLGATPALTLTDDSSLPRGDQARTIEAWVKPTGPGVLAYYGDAGGLRPNGFLLGVSPTGLTLKASGGPASSISAAPGITVTDGRWHYVAVSYEPGPAPAQPSATAVPGTLSYYLDGQRIAVERRSFATTFPAPNPGLTVGAYPGALDEFAVYGHALSPDTIVQHWLAGMGASCTDSAALSPYGKAVLEDRPATYLRLDDDPHAGVALDSSGNCHPAAYATRAGVDRDARGAAAGAGSGAVANRGDGVTAFLGDDALPRDDQARAIEAWVKPTGPGVLAYYGNINGLQPNGFLLGVSPTGLTLKASGGPASSISAAPGITVTDGRWHYVAVSYQPGPTSVQQGKTVTTPGTLSYYLDGQRIAVERRSFATVLGIAPLDLGGFSGSLQDVAIYDHALSTAQVQAHYRAAGVESIGRRGRATKEVALVSTGTWVG